MSEDGDYEFLSAGPDAGAPSKDYVRFNEQEDVLSSLDLLKLITPLIEEHPTYWKWAIVAAHGALQGAMVCALTDTTGISVLTKQSGSAMLNWLQADSETRGEPPKERLASFEELLKRCRKQLSLPLTPEQLRDIDRLHEDFRNSFTHFTPKGWSIEKVGLRRIIGAALDAIEDLMSRSRALIHLDEDDQRRLATGLKETRKSLGLKNRDPVVQ